MNNSDNTTESFTEVAPTTLVNIQVDLKSQKMRSSIPKSNIEKKNSKANEKNHNLQKFLISFKVKKGQEYTHTSMNGGIYFIPDQFLPTLHQFISESKQPLHITEKHPENSSCICIDFDFRRPEQPCARIFGLDFLSRIVQLYNSHLSKMGINNDDLLVAIVLYRDQGYIDPKSGLFKDGFHIQYPLFQINYESQYELRRKVIEDLENSDWMIQTSNSIEDVIDLSVIKRNNWLLYRCCKPNLPPYQIKHIFQIINPDQLTDTLSYCQSTDLEWINLLSLRTTDNKTTIQIGGHTHSPRGMDHIMGDTPNLIGSKKKTAKSINHLTTCKTKIINDDNIQLIAELLDYLGIKRANEYTYWSRVGWALFNCCKNTQKALDLFIQWSQTAPNYHDGCCQKIFDEARTNGKLVGIGTLIKWVYEDQKPGYMGILDKMKKNYPHESLLIETLTGCSEPIAEFIYYLYKNQYVCSSIKYNKWYEFRSHRWVEIDNAYTLFKDLGQKLKPYYQPHIEELGQLLNDLQKQFDDNLKQITASQVELRKVKKRIRSDHNDQLIEQLEETINNKKILNVNLKIEIKDAEKCRQNIKNAQRLISDMAGKNKIIKECNMKFYCQAFGDQLDSNRDLLCFENGVYDLQQRLFRDGRTDDYLLLTTGYNYQPFDDSDPSMEQLKNFLGQLFPDHELREFMLLVMSTYLSGHNPREKFYIWIGTGGNGKSKLLELLDSVFGKYSAKVPVSLLTQKRGNSGSASPELSNLRGARLVAAQETEENDKFQVGIMKDLTGGDRIYCRPLYNDPYYFKPQFKLLVCCNHLPSLPAEDDGTWRRIEAVPFESKFVEHPIRKNEFPRDEKLSIKMEKWVQPLSYLLIQYYHKFQQIKNLEIPQKIKEQIKQYKTQVDDIQQFIDQYLIRDTESSVTWNDIIKSYNQYKNMNITGNSKESSELRKQIVLKIFQTDYKPIRINGLIQRGWNGYQLKMDEIENDQINDLL